ncbi:MAG: flagellar hook-basal body complex protein FliE [Legionellaceae bacterium]|nr:flagellar hook-basal body complex protein FliE [Legionellaceae bacterium]
MTQINTIALAQQMQQMSLQAKGAVAESQGTNSPFSLMMQKALGSVNDLTQQAESLRGQYELGDDKVSISEVMIATQKSNLAFEGTLRVRNKLVQAYQDIMNMPL